MSRALSERRLENSLGALCLVLLAAPASARDLNAGFVVDTMSGEEQFAYVAGVVEGLAAARFLADSEATEGRSCIYQWFYDEADSMTNVLAAFAYFPDKLPGRVVQAMLAERCPP